MFLTMAKGLFCKDMTSEITCFIMIPCFLDTLLSGNQQLREGQLKEGDTEMREKKEEEEAEAAR